MMALTALYTCRQRCGRIHTQKTNDKNNLYALHALSFALGYNIRWLMRSLLAKVRRALSWLVQMVAVAAIQPLRA